MELYDALLTTRAMRRYGHEPVTDEEILHCLQAAQQAPSGGNLQPWQYLVVTDPALRAEVGALYRAAYDRYERTLLTMTPRFRTPEDEASWRRTADSVPPSRRSLRRGAGDGRVPHPPHRLDAE